MILQKPFWFSNKSPQIVDYAFASSALSPLFAPEKINGVHYIDGGFFTNVPILKAIEEGATSVDVMLLQPMGNEASMDKMRKAVKDKKVGPHAAEHFIDIVTRHLTLNAEIRVACLQNPKVSIRAVIPRAAVGETLGFSESEVNKMITDGYNHANKYDFEDLCQAASHLKSEIGEEFRSIAKMRTQVNAEDSIKSSNIFVNIGAGVGGMAIGALGVVAILSRRRKFDAKAFYEIPSQRQ